MPERLGVGSQVDHVSGRDRRGSRIIAADQQVALVVEPGRLPHNEAVPCQLNPDSGSKGRRVAAKFRKNRGGVSEPGRQLSQQTRQQTVAVLKTSLLNHPTLGHRGRCWLAFDRAYVDPDPHHHRLIRLGYVLGEYAAELARSRTVQHHQIVGPFRQHGRGGQLIRCTARRRTHRGHHTRNTIRTSRQQNAHQQRSAPVIVPLAPQAASARALVVGNQNRG